MRGPQRALLPLPGDPHTQGPTRGAWLMDPRWKEGKEGVAPRFIPIGSKEPIGAASLVVGLQLSLGRIWASSWPKKEA